jgi:hypothetical protein
LRADTPKGLPGREYDGARFDDDRGGHVESYFLKINDPSGERALWLKATILAHDTAHVHHAPEPVAETWAIAFERGKRPVCAKSTVALPRARFSPDSLDVEMPDLALSRTRARGKVGVIAVDLALEDTTAPLVHFPHPWMYAGPFPSSKLVSPMPDLRARGTVDLGDRTWRVDGSAAGGTSQTRTDGWRGLLGHNWGRGHAFAYAWAHCNVWDVEQAPRGEAAEQDLVFEGTTARVRVGPVLTPPATLLVVRHAGQTHALTHLRQMFRNRGSMTLRRWQFSGSGPTIRVRGEMWAETSDMVGLRYENPDGAVTYCLNSKLASARLEVQVCGGASFTARSRAAALEIGTRDPNHGVEMFL